MGYTNFPNGITTGPSSTPAGGSTGNLRLYDGAGTYYIELSPPAALTANRTVSLADVDVVNGVMNNLVVNSYASTVSTYSVLVDASQVGQMFLFMGSHSQIVELPVVSIGRTYGPFWQYGSGSVIFKAPATQSVVGLMASGGTVSCNSAGGCFTVYGISAMACGVTIGKGTWK